MLQELEKAIQKDLDNDFPDVPTLKANFAGLRTPGEPLSVADQLLTIAGAIRNVNVEIDATQEEFDRLLDQLRAEMAKRFDLLRVRLGKRT